MPPRHAPARVPARSICLVAVLMATSLGVAACGGSAAPAASSSSPTPTASTSASPSESESPTRAALPPVSEAVAAGATRIDLPGAPDWISLAGGSAWTVTDGLARLDGKTGKLLSATPLPGGVCLAMDVGFGSLWIGTCESPPSLVRVDPRRRRSSTRSRYP